MRPANYAPERRRFQIEVLALLCATYAAGCGISPPPNLKPIEPNVASLDPTDWHIYYSAEMSSHPSPDASGAWALEFPGSGGHVNYVQTPFNASTSPERITITFMVESDAAEYKVMDTTDKPPATVHLFFEQQNDDLRNPNGRWWSFVSGYNLGSLDNTIQTISVPLTPDIWSNVDGQHDSNAFYAALRNVGWVGITFGGQNFWGHGVAMNRGRAKYILINFSVD